MNTKTKNETVVFKTLEEYLAYYSLPGKQKLSKGGKYYRIGEGVAKMACDKASENIQGEV